MARRKAAKVVELIWPDAFADEAKSKTVWFFRPADWDIDEATCTVEWAHVNTGWFYRDSSNIWQGPFLTSTEAAAAEVAYFQKAA